MKVKIGNRIYTTDKDGPIMLILEADDKKNISKMLPGCTRYCQFQKDKHTREEIEQFMEIEE